MSVWVWNKLLIKKRVYVLLLFCSWSLFKNSFVAPLFHVLPGDCYSLFYILNCYKTAFRRLVGSQHNDAKNLEIKNTKNFNRLFWKLSRIFSIWARATSVQCHFVFLLFQLFKLQILLKVLKRIRLLMNSVTVKLTGKLIFVSYTARFLKLIGFWKTRQITTDNVNRKLSWNESSSQVLNSRGIGGGVNCDAVKF